MWQVTVQSYVQPTNGRASCLGTDTHESLGSSHAPKRALSCTQTETTEGKPQFVV